MRAVSLYLRFLVLATCLTGCQPGEEETSAETKAETPQIEVKQQALETSLCGSTAGLQANSPWPMRGGCPSHSAQSSEYGSLQNTKNWQTPVSSIVQGAAAIGADNSIYIGDSGGMFYRLNAATGAVLKSVSLGGAVRSSPAIAADGTIYVGSDNNRLNALDPITLATKWTFATAARNGSSPAVGPDGTIYFGSEDWYLYALNPNGTLKWRYATGSIVQSSPALGPNGIIYITSLDWYVYAINPNGTLKWRKALDWGIQNSVSLTRNSRLVVSASNKLYVLDTATGNIVWQKTLTGAEAVYTPTVGANGVIYAGTFGQFAVPCSMYAFTGDGEQLWKFDSGFPFESQPVIDRVGNVYFGGGDGSVYAFDPAGRMIWTYYTGLNVASSPVIARGGAVIFGSFNGNVYSIGTGAARLPAGSACTSDSSCEPGLVCGKANGARLANPASSNVCWSPSCENKIKDVGETEIDCGGACGSCARVCSLACTAGSQVAAPAEEVLAFATGAFLRASSASYQTDAERIEFSKPNELRFETLSPTGGRLALFEGERVNRATWSDQLNKWRQTVSNQPARMIKLTENYAAGPDLAQNADRLVAPANGFTGTDQLVYDGQPASVLSAWLRLTDPSTYNPSQPSTTRAKLENSLFKNRADGLAWTLPAAWERRTAKCEATNDTLTLGMTHEAGITGTNVSYTSLPAADYLVWGYQLESGSFSSSYIPSEGAIAKRRADRLVYEAASVPAWVRSGLWQLDVSPIMASSELATTDELVLVAWETGALSLIKDGTGAAVKIANGSNVAKRNITWIKGKRFTVTVNTTSRIVEVFGATSGNGSVSYPSTISIPTGRLAIGALIDGTKGAFARLSEIRRVNTATSSCVVDADCSPCGNGVIDAGEVCDTGLTAHCRIDCQAVAAPPVCTTSDECPLGESCPTVPNGAAFDRRPDSRVCVPTAICLDNPTPACGAVTSPCGRCLCTPNCDGKQCGQSLSDGCGGQCFDVCSRGEPGCQNDTDCEGSDVCGNENSWRYGASAGNGTKACWPAACEDGDPRRIDCATQSSPCGLCDPSVAQTCFDGPLCGARDGHTCPAGEVMNAVGDCFAVSPLIGVAPVSDDAPTSSIGALPAKLSVSRTGSALYNVPVNVPPGRGGLTPELSFAYNSQAGNGTLGIGWSLSGLSTVSLCPKTVAADVELDGFPAFCLDGQQLQPVAFANGQTEWRTEFDSMARIYTPGNFMPRAPTGNMTPITFTVQRKDGSTWIYGGLDAHGHLTESLVLSGRVYLTPDRLPYHESYTDIRAWALSSITDRAGNKIEIRYSTELSFNLGQFPLTTELIPRWIGYNFAGTGSDKAVNEVVFEYQDDKLSPCRGPRAPNQICSPNRPDFLTGFSFGEPLSQTHLLSKVTVRAMGQDVRAYKLSYGGDFTSKLERIDECGYGSGGAEVCRPKTSYGYALEASQPVPAGLADDSSLVFDWNSDGYDDVVQYGSSGTSKVLIGSPNGLQDQGIVINHGLTSGFRNNHRFDDYGDARKSVVDFDGDGKQDLLIAVPGEYPNKDRLLKVAAGETTATEVLIPWPDQGIYSKGELIPIDLTGDGLPEIVRCAPSSTRQFYRNIGGRLDDGLEFPNVNFEPAGSCDESVVINLQDGREALIFAYGSQFYVMSMESSLDEMPVQKPIDLGYRPADLMLDFAMDQNGDGLRDIFLYSRPWAETNFAVALNPGRLDSVWPGGARGSYADPHIVDTRKTWPPVPGGGGVFIDNRPSFIVPFDANQDGRTDVFTTTRANVPGQPLPVVSLVGHDGRNLPQGEVIATPVYYPITRDANGDGSNEWGSSTAGFIQIDPLANLLTSVTIHSHASDVPDTIKIDYASGAGTGVFSPGAGSQYCGVTTRAVCLRKLPQPVVKKVARASYAQRPGPLQAVQTQEASYRYGPLVVDTGGRGIIGFATRSLDLTNVDGVDQLHVEETYDLSTKTPSQGALNYYYPFADEPTNVVTTFLVPNNELTNNTASVEGKRQIIRQFETKQSDKGLPFTTLTSELNIYTEGGTLADYQTVQRGFDKYGNLKSELATWGFEAAQMVRALRYVYEDEPARVDAWQVDLLKSDISVDSVPCIGAGCAVQTSTLYKYLPNGLLNAVYERHDPNVPDSGLITSLGRGAYNNIELVGHGTSLNNLRFWSYSYDDLAGVYVEQSQNPQGHIQRFETSYGDGLTRLHQDANLVTTRWKYDEFGRMAERRRTEGTSEVGFATYALSPAALDVSQGLPTNSVYTLTTRTSASPTGIVGFSSKESYDSAGRVTARLSQASSLASAPWVSQEFAYDARGLLVTRRRPHLSGDNGQGSETFAYDSLGRLTERRYADLVRKDKIFYASRATANVTQPLTGAHRYELRESPGGTRQLLAYDARGKVLQTRENGNVAQTFFYGGGSFLLSTTDAVGNVITRVPDVWGRLAHTSDPDHGVHDYAYNLFGELEVDNHNGEEHRFTYDGLGRPSTLINSDGESRWTWDAVTYDAAGVAVTDRRIGQLMATKSADGHTQRFSYHGFGGTMDEQVSGFSGVPRTLTTRFESDSFLRQSIIHYPGNEVFAVKNSYDDAGDGALVKVENANNASEVFWRMTDVYQGMQPKTEQFGDGTTLSSDYQGQAGWLLSMHLTGPGQTGDLLGIGIERDANENVTSVRRFDDPTETVKTSYCYDALNRVVGVTRGSCTQPYTIASYSYTATGNIKTKRGVGEYQYGIGGQPDSGPQTLPHAVRLTVDGPVQHIYDYDPAFGRMRSRLGPSVPTGLQRFAYTALGKLRSVTDAQQQVERFEYNVSGERALRVHADLSKTAYVGAMFEQDMAADGTVTGETRRVFDNGKVVAERISMPSTAPSTQYLHRDHLGSVALITARGANNQVQVLERRSTDLFGQSTTSATSRSELGFTGHRSDVELGIIDMTGRFYDPRLGRFLTPDPFIPDPLWSQSYNRFSYVDNNPATMIDPTGFFGCDAAYCPVPPLPPQEPPPRGDDDSKKDDGKGDCSAGCTQPRGNSGPNWLTTPTNRTAVSGPRGTGGPSLHASSAPNSAGPVAITGANDSQLYVSVTTSNVVAALASVAVELVESLASLKVGNPAGSGPSAGGELKVVNLTLLDPSYTTWRGLAINTLLGTVSKLLPAVAKSFLGSVLDRGITAALGEAAGEATSSAWAAVRTQLGQQLGLPRGTPIHHWLIPQGGTGRLTLKGFFNEQWGRFVPDGIKNARWNLMVPPAGSQGSFMGNLWHMGLHGKGQFGLGLGGRLWFGSPTWAKFAAGGASAGAGYYGATLWDE